MTTIRVPVVAVALALVASACDTARNLETAAAAASHPTPFVATHTSAALADLGGCKTCHGDDFAGGVTGVSCNNCHGRVTDASGTAGFSDWQTNCTFCHGTRTLGGAAATSPLVAPPRGTAGETATTEAAVGAHQKHLGNGSTMSAGVSCNECHATPTDLSHVKGAQAVLTFGALATKGGLAPSYAGGTCASTYCHGTGLSGGANTTPTWTGTVACGDCHAASKGSPPSSGLHRTTINHSSQHCSACHATVAADTDAPSLLATSEARQRHVDGNKDVSFAGAGTWDPVTKSCSSVGCHTRAPTLRYW